MSKHAIAFQLYSARNFPPLETVLEGLAKIGYDAVEPYYPLYGENPAGYRAKVDAAGLVTPTFHAPLDGVTGETARFIDIAKTIGASTIVIPYMVAEQRPTDVDGWKKLHRELCSARPPKPCQGRQPRPRLSQPRLRICQTLADGSRPIDHSDRQWRQSPSSTSAGSPAPARTWPPRSTSSSDEIDRLPHQGPGPGRHDRSMTAGPMSAMASVDWKPRSGRISQKAQEGDRILVAEHDNPARIGSSSPSVPIAAIKALAVS